MIFFLQRLTDEAVVVSPDRHILSADKLLGCVELLDNSLFKLLVNSSGRATAAIDDAKGFGIIPVSLKQGKKSGLPDT